MDIETIAAVTGGTKSKAPQTLQSLVSSIDIENLDFDAESKVATYSTSGVRFSLTLKEYKGFILVAIADASSSDNKLHMGTVRTSEVSSRWLSNMCKTFHRNVCYPLTNFRSLAYGN